MCSTAADTSSSLRPSMRSMVLSWTAVRVFVRVTVLLEPIGVPGHSGTCEFGAGGKVKASTTLPPEWEIDARRGPNRACAMEDLPDIRSMVLRQLRGGPLQFLLGPDHRQVGVKRDDTRGRDPLPFRDASVIVIEHAIQRIAMIKLLRQAGGMPMAVKATNHA